MGIFFSHIMGVNHHITLIDWSMMLPLPVFFSKKITDHTDNRTEQNTHKHKQDANELWLTTTKIFDLKEYFCLIHFSSKKKRTLFSKVMIVTSHCKHLHQRIKQTMPRGWLPIGHFFFCFPSRKKTNCHSVLFSR